MSGQRPPRSPSISLNAIGGVEKPFFSSSASRDEKSRRLAVAQEASLVEGRLTSQIQPGTIQVPSTRASPSGRPGPVPREQPGSTPTPSLAGTLPWNQSALPALTPIATWPEPQPQTKALPLPPQATPAQALGASWQPSRVPAQHSARAGDLVQQQPSMINVPSAYVLPAPRQQQSTIPDLPSSWLPPQLRPKKPPLPSAVPAIPAMPSGQVMPAVPPGQERRALPSAQAGPAPQQQTRMPSLPLGEPMPAVPPVHARSASRKQLIVPGPQSAQAGSLSRQLSGPRIPVSGQGLSWDVIDQVPLNMAWAKAALSGRVSPVPPADPLTLPASDDVEFLLSDGILPSLTPVEPNANESSGGTSLFPSIFHGPRAEDNNTALTHLLPPKTCAAQAGVGGLGGATATLYGGLSSSLPIRDQLLPRSLGALPPLMVGEFSPQRGGDLGLQNHARAAPAPGVALQNNRSVASPASQHIQVTGAGPNTDKIQAEYTAALKQSMHVARIKFREAKSRLEYLEQEVERIHNLPPVESEDDLFRRTGVRPIYHDYIVEIMERYSSDTNRINYLRRTLRKYVGLYPKSPEEEELMKQILRKITKLTADIRPGVVGAAAPAPAAPAAPAAHHDQRGPREVLKDKFQRALEALGRNQLRQIVISPKYPRKQCDAVIDLWLQGTFGLREIYEQTGVNTSRIPKWKAKVLDEAEIRGLVSPREGSLRNVSGQS